MKISIFLKLTGSKNTVVQETSCNFDSRKNIQKHSNPASIYFFEVKRGNTGKICEICSTLTIKTSKRRQ